MLRRIIVVLLLILVSAAVTSLVSGGAALVAGNLEDGGARQVFTVIAVIGLLVSAIVFCLLVLAMAVYLVEQSSKHATEAESSSTSEA
jgi:heme/copper-type cytochrome/quinol oxidase subunit 2|tara:strand:+ start:13907 stop:14170 length:264 start_codon:yes stop_codon:yes gene_type:complete